MYRGGVRLRERGGRRGLVLNRPELHHLAAGAHVGKQRGQSPARRGARRGMRSPEQLLFVLDNTLAQFPD